MSHDTKRVTKSVQESRCIQVTHFELISLLIGQPTDGVQELVLREVTKHRVVHLVRFDSVINSRPCLIKANVTQKVVKLIVAINFDVIVDLLNYFNFTIDPGFSHGHLQ